MFKKNSQKVLFPIFIAWLALITSSTPCASDAKVLSSADSLISLHKYESAFKLLANADPQNKDLDISIKKSSVAMNFYAKATKHRMFGFKDLRPGLDVKSPRAAKDILPKYNFPIDSVMLAAIKNYPDRCEPFRVLGEFYYETKNIYGKDWDMPVDSQKKLSQYYCSIAVEKGCADWKTYSILGVFELVDSNYVRAILDFSKSTSLKDTIPTVTFNLAYAYLIGNISDSTIKYAKQAMKYFSGNDAKANCASMIAEAYRRLKENALVWVWCDSAVRLDPSNADNHANVLDLCLATNNYKEALRSALALFNLAPESPSNLKVVLSLFMKNNAQDSLPGFFQKLLKAKRSNQALGNIYYYKGIYYLQVNNNAECKKAIITAKGYFEKDKAKNKQVIGIIDKKLNDLK